MINQFTYFIKLSLIISFITLCLPVLLTAGNNGRYTVETDSAFAPYLISDGYYPTGLGNPKFHWDQPKDGVAWYFIERNYDNEGYSLIDSVYNTDTTVCYIDSLVEGHNRGDDFEYRVRARDSLNVYSDYSNVLLFEDGRYAKPITSVKSLPQEYGLEQNYPNPFNPTTTIRYALPEKAEVNLVVYDLVGREVANLVSGIMNAGNHQVRFNAADLSTGIYIYQLNVASLKDEAGAKRLVGKMMLIK